ncbi:hypothetical protein O59_000398 [Cellvibrio sp. BR]|nr:hypothetical protein O59_000398 [Cellvibrio sp. BR]
MLLNIYIKLLGNMALEPKEHSQNTNIQYLFIDKRLINIEK